MKGKISPEFSLSCSSKSLPLAWKGDKRKEISKPLQRGEKVFFPSPIWRPSIARQRVSRVIWRKKKKRKKISFKSWMSDWRKKLQISRHNSWIPGEITWEKTLWNSAFMISIIKNIFVGNRHDENLEYYKSSVPFSCLDSNHLFATAADCLPPVFSLPLTKPRPSNRTATRPILSQF